MKDYTFWNATFDYENESSWVNPNRPWFKHRNAADPKEPKTIKYEPIPMNEFVKLKARQCMNNVCAVFAGKKYTYRELISYSDRIANALFQLGVKKGRSVGIYTPNTPEFIFVTIGAMSTGASITPINPLLKKEDVVHIIKEAGIIDTVFVHESLYSELEKARQEIEIKNVIVIGTDNVKSDAVTFKEFLKNKAARPPDVDIDPMNDVAALLFTGGTTGLPKGVMLTHNNLVSNSIGMSITAAPVIGKIPSISILPMCHSYGLLVLFIQLLLGMMMVMMKFDPSDVLEAIEYYKVPMFAGVPVMYQALVNSPDFTERDLSSLAQASSGSAALPPEIARKWESVTGIKLAQGYGLTETSPATHGQAVYMPENRIDSIGVPVINTDAIIVDPDTLVEKAIDEVGELWVRGPQIMKGYWRQPEATNRVLVKDKEGKEWLRTGDLARMDKDGYFYIAGRSKEMIKYKGYKVMPAEVEKKLFEHPAILEAGVVGVPDPNIGETIKAFVALKPEYKGKITEREIIDWAKERLAGYKYPRQVEFIDEVPRTSVGKIFRRKLLEMELAKQKQ